MNNHDEIVDDFSEALKLISELVNTSELNMDSLDTNTVHVLNQVKGFQSRIISKNDKCVSCEMCSCAD